MPLGFTSRRAPWLGEELDTAWVSEVWVGGSAGAPPHPNISLPPSGPLPAASRLCGPAPLSGLQPASAHPGLCTTEAATAPAGTMPANVSAREPGYANAPACENSPAPPASTA